MWRVTLLVLSISFLQIALSFNETECTSDEDCEIQNAFCTDSGICAEGPSFECPENMLYQECGSACPRTCADVLEPNPLKACVEMCVPGCFCDVGYALDGETNKCVPEAKCQKEDTSKVTQKREVTTGNVSMQCPENAEFSNCTNLCPEKHCGNLLQNNFCFSLRCGSPGCRCMEGNVLKTAGNIADGCVNIETCPDFDMLQKSIGKRQAEEKPQDPRCPQNAEYKECTNKTDCVSLRCGPPACQCKQGHVRLTNDDASACVRREACPKMRLRRFLNL
uniref:TIL domain-containing protein n=1 Tax=Acrobeloides nanus TaxID=290746 RepID=A0A914DZM8_9BILA